MRNHRQARARRRFESLEPRRLLAAYINEVLFDPLFGSRNTDQYIELRGAPGVSLAAGSYLVLVESEAAAPTAGEVHGIFDLSGLTFGSNGFLVLLPQDSPFTSHPWANTLQSTKPGFGGLPGDIYTDSHPITDTLDFIYGANSLFLLQSDTAPQLGHDIDVDNDGYLDATGMIENWNVLDSVSTLWGLSTGFGYGQTVFVDNHGVLDPTITHAEGATVVRVDGLGYIARVGNSTGATAQDWVAGQVVDETGDELFLRFTGGVFGVPRPTAFHGRELDSVGSENFTGAVRAYAFDDINGDGQRAGNEPAQPGVILLADTNANGIRDLITTVIEPNHFPEDIELDNLTKGVTLTTAGEDNVIHGFNIQSSEDFWHEGAYNFSHAGVDFFNSSRRLRMDFYRPAQSVSIDVIGNSNSSMTYGRLEVFDAAGNSLQMVRTGPLVDQARQRLTITMGSDVIAYAVAYPDEQYLDSSPFGKLDSLAFSVPEAIATTDADGRATLNYLDPGNYTIVPLQGPLGSNYLIDPQPIQITKYQNFDLQIPAYPNAAPEFVDANLSVPELAAAGTVVGTVTATDAPVQTVRYTLLEGGSLFTLDSASGQLRVREGAVLDHESAMDVTIRVLATDDAHSPLSSEATFTVQVTDVNEKPTVGNSRFELPENPAVGTVIGMVAASDPDSGVGGLAGFRILGINQGQAFTLDTATGELRVNNPSLFNYEIYKSLSITVEAYDGGTPSLTGSRRITVDILDRNEPAQIVTESLSAGELTVGGTAIGKIAVTDPEATQTHTFGWAEGFTNDLFTINPVNGQISLAAAATLDFASAEEHVLEVQVTDSGVPAEIVTGTVRVRVINENNPPRIADSMLAIAENSDAGTVVGVITATDPDPETQFIFGIVGGSGLDRFVIDSSSGEVRVADGAMLDHESDSEWEIEVQVWDTGQPVGFASRSFTVLVGDENEAPVITPIQLSISEHASGGTEVGVIAFSDPDTGDQPLISLVESAAGPFSIDPATGIVSLQADTELDFETAVEHVLTVRVDDGVNPPVEMEVVVSVLDANDPPVPTGIIDAIDIVAGTLHEHSIGTDWFTDVDAGQSLTLTVTGLASSLPEWMHFDPVTGKLTVTPWNPDEGEHRVTIVATDNGTPPLSSEIELRVRVEFNAVPWHNTTAPEDVNNDGKIHAIDALTVINYLNRATSDQVPLRDRIRPNFLDVNGNNRIEPIDALRVINLLNRQTTSGGEAPVEASPSAMAAAASWLEEEKRRKSTLHDQAILEYVRPTDLS